MRSDNIYRWWENNLKKVLVTPQGFYFVKDKLGASFNKNIEYIFTKGMVKNNEILKASLRECSGLVVGSETINKDIIDSSPSLKLIVRFGTSVENIDQDYLAFKKIKLFKIKSNHTVEGVANLCLTFALNYIFNTYHHSRDSSYRVWKRYMNSDPSNTTIGLVGAGDIAKSFYIKAQNLGFKVIYHSRNRNNFFDEQEVDFYPALGDLILNSDIVSLHLPFNMETKNFIGKGELADFQDKLLINTSRGGIVNLIALKMALKENKSFYYFTDVLGEEPPQEADLDLISGLNVMSTAHIGGYSEAALLDVSLQTIQIINDEI